MTQLGFMFGRIKKFWSAAPLATAIAGLAILAACFFAAQLIAFTLYWANPENRDQEIATWMTPGYIAHSWRVPPAIVFDAVGARSDRRERISLEDISIRNGEPVEVVVSRIEAAIAEFRATRGERK